MKLGTAKGTITVDTHGVGMGRVGTGRNIRPVTGKRLPVVDFSDELEECPTCDGSGEDFIDCDACQGKGCDDEGHPCKPCNATGQVWGECPMCDGDGQVAKE